MLVSLTKVEVLLNVAQLLLQHYICTSLFFCIVIGNGFKPVERTEVAVHCTCNMIFWNPSSPGSVSPARSLAGYQFKKF